MGKAEKEKARASVPEAEQPYQIPDNWQWVTLGDITNVVGGGTPSTKNKAYYENGDIPWITPADLSNYFDIYISHGAKNITRLGLEKSSAQLLPADTVCLSTRAPIGYVVIAKNPLSTNQGFKSFPPSPFYTPQYLYWYLKGNRDLLESRASGTTFLELSGRKAASIEMPLPPLAEQERIVARIESLFTALDEVREQVRAALNSLEAWKGAVLREAFAGKLTAEWRNRHPHAGPWTKRALKDCGDWSGGGTPSMERPEYWENGDLLWITPKDMKSDCIQDSLLHINALAVSQSSANYIEKPSVLFVTRSGILRRTLPIATVKVPFTVNQDLKVLSPYSEIDTDYLFWACKSLEKSILKTCMKNGTTVESINTKPLMAFEIPIAPKEEQLEIVSRLEVLLSRGKTAAEASEKVLEQIDLMKKIILARAFRGELGTNRPEEERASLD